MKLSFMFVSPASLIAYSLFLDKGVEGHPGLGGWLRKVSASGTDGSWLWGWAWGGDSSVTIVDRSPPITFASRPASFGAILDEPLMGYIIPMSSFTVPCLSGADETLPNFSNLGCPTLCMSGPHEPERTESWIALVQRGSCQFVDKVREAQKFGAKAVVVGGSSPGESGNPDVLVNMYSPGDSSDVAIPATFITYSDYMRLSRLIASSNTSTSGLRTLSMQISADYSNWEWYSPVLTFIILLLLPSCLTLVTLLIHRVRAARAARRDRAPEDIVNGLPWCVWTGTGWEKHEGAVPHGAEQTTSAEAPASVDLERGEADVQGDPSTSNGERHWFDEQTECAICLSDFAKGDRVRVLPCKHIFHLDEVDRWLIERKKLCPVCKADVTQPLPSTTPLPPQHEALPASYPSSPSAPDSIPLVISPATENTPLLTPDSAQDGADESESQH